MSSITELYFGVCDRKIMSGLSLRIIGLWRLWEVFVALVTRLFFGGWGREVKSGVALGVLGLGVGIPTPSRALVVWDSDGLVLGGAGLAGRFLFLRDRVLDGPVASVWF